jgi:hypothetical protein
MEVVMLHKNSLALSKNRLLPVLAALLALALASTGAAMASGAPPAAAPAAAPQVALARAAAAPVALPVTGTLTNAAGQTVGKVTGQVTSFVVRKGRLTALANLTGSAGSASQTLNGVALPIADGTNPVARSGVVNCQILNLVLRPLDLNLLGLVVHLDRLHLNITAVPGSGNLLGNLLCSVTHLLDGPNFLGNVRSLLNQVLAIIDKIQNP